MTIKFICNVKKINTRIATAKINTALEKTGKKESDCF